MELFTDLTMNTEHGLFDPQQVIFSPGDHRFIGFLNRQGLVVKLCNTAFMGTYETYFCVVNNDKVDAHHARATLLHDSLIVHTKGKMWERVMRLLRQNHVPYHQNNYRYMGYEWRRLNDGQLQWWRTYYTSSAT